MPETEEKPPENETVSEIRERLQGEKEEAAATEPDKIEGELCPILSCGRVVKSLRHHINYMAGKGERAHLEYKETRGTEAAAAETEHFSPGAGDALVYVLLSAIVQKRPDLIVPEGWTQRAGEVHQKVLERYVGPWLGEKSDLVYLGLVWGELLTVNLAAAAPGAEPTFPLEDPAVSK